MNEFDEIIQRIQASIVRIPDSLTREGNGPMSTRAKYSGAFASCIVGHETEPIFFGSLPFPAALLTDPHIYIVAGGLLVLDHPIRSGQFEQSIEGKAHVLDLNRNHSLYENRFPRLIACARRGERIAASWMINRLGSLGFKGPFAARENVPPKKGASYA